MSEYLVIGDELSKVRDEMNQKFEAISMNMEMQLSELRRQLEAEKRLTADLRNQLKDSQEQCEEFKQECTERTNDLNQINAFYQSNADKQQFEVLLQDVTERHQALKEALNNCNYNKNTDPMNKEWQDEIYKIIQNINNSANASEQAAVIDELINRTRELETIKKIMNGEEAISLMEELADQCEERHAAQLGDPMSTYKAPGKIEDKNALADNEDWENLLREFVSNPPSGGDDSLQNRNDLYLQELGDRIGDLQQVKDIISKKKDESIGQEDIEEQARNLLYSVQQRHNDTEDKVTDTINKNNNDDISRLNNYKNNDTTWRRELGNLIQHIVEHQDEPEEMWWLDLDDGRRQHYDNILLDQQEKDILMKDAIYLNRELPNNNNNNNNNNEEEKDNDNDNDNDKYTELYIPIDPIN
eukprot:368036_1